MSAPSVLDRRFYVHQPKAQLDQPGALQNQWYPVIALNSYVRAYSFNAQMDTLAETVEGRITIDGRQIMVAGAALVAGALYTAVWDDRNYNAELMWRDDASPATMTRAFLIEGKSVLIELRKTTNNGANNLKGEVEWARYI